MGLCSPSSTHLRGVKGGFAPNIGVSFKNLLLRNRQPYSDQTGHAASWPCQNLNCVPNGHISPWKGKGERNLELGSVPVSYSRLNYKYLMFWRVAGSGCILQMKYLKRNVDFNDGKCNHSRMENIEDNATSHKEEEDHEEGGEFQSTMA